MQLSLMIRTELASFQTEIRKEMKAELKKTKVIIFNRDQNHEVRGAESLNLNFWGVYGSYSVKVVMYFSITTADLFFWLCLALRIQPLNNTLRSRKRNCR